MKKKLKKEKEKECIKHKEKRKKDPNKKKKRNGDLIFLYSKGHRGRNEAFHPSVRRVIHPNTTNIYLKKGP